jgi:hypothetical protein
MLYIERKKLYSIIIIAIASLLHTSALVLYFIYFITLFYTEKKWFYYVLLPFSFIFGFTFKIEWLNILNDFTPIGSYAWYIQSGGIDYLPIIVKLTKYIYIPFYIFSITYIVGKNKLTKQESIIFFIGFICFCLRLASLNISLVFRITDTFLLFSIFPLYFYFRELYKDKKYYIFSFSILFLLTIYFFKTIVFAAEEYMYKSIYF